MCMLDFYKAIQMNYLRHFVKKNGKVTEPFNIKLSPNEAFDRILMSLFRIDN